MVSSLTAILCRVGLGLAPLLLAACLPAVSALQPGAAAPAFTLAGLDGQPVTLAALRGRPLLLTFFASWCAPCAKEISLLRDIAAPYPDLQLVFVSVRDADDAVAEFARRFGIERWPVLLDRDGSAARVYRVGGVPASFFIDAEGILQAKRLGALDPASLEAALAEIARGSQAPEEARPHRGPAPVDLRGPWCRLSGC
jgi:peroxiredoxin